ncbi:MAG: DUF192 domain-containing protein [Dehalococcoidales bacterium]|nr:DUF192 domain-containing protein [Dehalococcoidales bacterium]
MPGQATVTIRDKLWNVDVAATPWELEQGLGGLSEIPPGTGMLFDIGVEQAIQVTTVPMLFSLDIVFLSEALVVTEVYRDIQPGYLVNSTLPARYFLEVNAGETEGLENGDQVTVEILSGQESGALPEWVPALIAFIGTVVMGVLWINVARDLMKGLFGEPRQPELLPQTKPVGKEDKPVKNQYQIEVVIVDRDPHHKLVKIYKKGHVYAATYAEPFPTKESALADYLRNPRKFEPFDESTMSYLPVAEENHSTNIRGAVLPANIQPRKNSELKYLADSPEYLTKTIEDTGYRNRIDSAFQEAITRVRQGK